MELMQSAQTLTPPFRAQGLQGGQRIQHAGRSLGMDAPKPAHRRGTGQKLLHDVEIESLAPRKLQVSKRQPEPCGVIHQPLAKFAIAQDQPRLFLQGQLRGHRVIGQRPRAEQYLDMAGADQLAKPAAGLLKIGDEEIGAVRLRRAFKGLAHLCAEW